MCGLAPRIGVLIACRAIQALGAAMLFALGPAVLTGAIPGVVVSALRGSLRPPTPSGH